VPLIIYDAPPLYEDEHQETKLTIDVHVGVLKATGQRLLKFEVVGDRGFISDTVSLHPQLTISDALQQAMAEVFNALPDIC